MTRLLVIEDSPQMVRAVDTTLKSMGFEYDAFTNQQSAREHLASETCPEYACVLLDLNIPFDEHGDNCRPQNGANLLIEMRAHPKTAATPIVIMSAHIGEGHRYAVDLMKLGASDVIDKPFPETGQTLDVVIREALERRRQQRASPLPAPFDGGELLLDQHQATLAGVKIIGDQNSEESLLVLDLLRNQVGGQFVALGAHDIGAAIGAAEGPTTVHGCVYTLRRNAKERLWEERRITCEQDDFIETVSSGYRLKHWISVRVLYDTSRVALPTGVTPPAEPPPRLTIPGLKLDEPHHWILSQLLAGEKLTRRQVEQRWNVVRQTAGKYLGTLVDAGIIEYSGKGARGYYRLTPKGRKVLAA